MKYKVAVVPALNKKNCKSKFHEKKKRIQGDPNQNLLIQIYTFDPMIVKPKCAWELHSNLDLGVVLVSREFTPKSREILNQGFM